MRERECLRKVGERGDEGGHEVEESGEDVNEMGRLEGERKRE